MFVGYSLIKAMKSSSLGYWFIKYTSKRKNISIKSSEKKDRFNDKHWRRLSISSIDHFLSLSWSSTRTKSIEDESDSIYLIDNDEDATTFPSDLTCRNEWEKFDLWRNEQIGLTLFLSIEEEKERRRSSSSSKSTSMSPQASVLIQLKRYLFHPFFQLNWWRQEEHRFIHFIIQLTTQIDRYSLQLLRLISRWRTLTFQKIFVVFDEGERWPIEKTIRCSPGKSINKKIFRRLFSPLWSCWKTLTIGQLNINEQKKICDLLSNDEIR